MWQRWKTQEGVSVSISRRSNLSNKCRYYNWLLKSGLKLTYPDKHGEFEQSRHAVHSEKQKRENVIATRPLTRKTTTKIGLGSTKAGASDSLRWPAMLRGEYWLVCDVICINNSGTGNGKRVLIRDPQKGGGSKPGGHRLDGLPLLFVNEAEEFFFGASSLVLPEDAILAAERVKNTPRYNVEQKQRQHHKEAANGMLRRGRPSGKPAADQNQRNQQLGPVQNLLVNGGQ